MKKIKEVIIFFLILLSVSKPIILKAQDNASILSGYTFTAGLSSKQLDFDYYRSENDSTPAGSMTEGMYSTYFLRFGSPYTLSENKKWGYYYETGISSFSMSKQNVSGIEKSLGTSVNGNYWYVTPIGFYLWGPAPANKKQLSLLTGIGLGLGYLNAKGDMILTEDGSNIRHKVDKNGIDLAVSILFEAHYEKWMSRIYGGGPYLDVARSTYAVFDFTWDIGYTYTF